MCLKVVMSNCKIRNLFLWHNYKTNGKKGAGGSYKWGLMKIHIIEVIKVNRLLIGEFNLVKNMNQSGCVYEFRLNHWHTTPWARIIVACWQGENTHTHTRNNKQSSLRKNKWGERSITYRTFTSYLSKLSVWLKRKFNRDFSFHESKARVMQFFWLEFIL